MSIYVSETFSVPVSRVPPKVNDVTEGADTNEHPVYVIDAMSTRYPTRNNRIYPESSFLDFAKSEYGIWSGVRSAVHNKGIPLLKFHRHRDNPGDMFTPPVRMAEDAVGRVIKSEWVQKNKREGVLRLYVKIFDEKTTEGLDSGKYAEVSIGARAQYVECSICGALNMECDHRPGWFYDKGQNGYPTIGHVPTGTKVKRAYIRMGRLWLHEVSIVNVAGCANTEVLGRLDENDSKETFLGGTVIESASIGESWDDSLVPTVTIESSRTNESAHQNASGNADTSGEAHKMAHEGVYNKIGDKIGNILESVIGSLSSVENKESVLDTMLGNILESVAKTAETAGTDINGIFFMSDDNKVFTTLSFEDGGYSLKEYKNIVVSNIPKVDEADTNCDSAVVKESEEPATDSTQHDNSEDIGTNIIDETTNALKDMPKIDAKGIQNIDQNDDDNPGEPNTSSKVKPREDTIIASRFIEI